MEHGTDAAADTAVEGGPTGPSTCRTPPLVMAGTQSPLPLLAPAVLLAAHGGWWDIAVEYYGGTIWEAGTDDVWISDRASLPTDSAGVAPVIRDVLACALLAAAYALLIHDDRSSSFEVSSPAERPTLAVVQA